jgi:phosphatidylglycerophosphate synthase
MTSSQRPRPLTIASIDALVLPPRLPQLDRTIVGGLSLAERAVLALHRAGVDRITVSSERLDDPDLVGRLAGKGVGVTIAHTEPFKAISASSALIVVSADVVFEPRTIAALVAAADDDTRGVYALSAFDGILCYLLPAIVARLRDEPLPERALLRLVRSDDLSPASTDPHFCRPLPLGRGVWRLERDYIRRRNGTEGVFTRAIRWFSVPVSQVLLRLHVSANQVTIAGLALALLAAVQFTHRAYWPGVIGGLLYYASMILDCSDGEVARASFGDSRFGAWLETVSDYLSYFFVLGGLVVGELHYHGVCHHVTAAMLAAIASAFIVLVVGRLRHQVARANPGAFDDAIVATFGHGSELERFAVATRSLIKRSFLAHLIVFQALIGHLAALLIVWAWGAAAALIVLLAVRESLVRRVSVDAIRGTLAVTSKEL